MLCFQLLLLGRVPLFAGSLSTQDAVRLVSGIRGSSYAWITGSVKAESNVKLGVRQGRGGNEQHGDW